MNTNKNTGLNDVSSEVEKLKNEILVNKEIVNRSRDAYASEIIKDLQIAEIRKGDTFSNKTYKKPKTESFFRTILNKIKIVIGLS